MGTTYTLFLYAFSAQQASDESEKAFATVDDVDNLLSNYKPQSELSRINRDAFSSSVTTDPETFRFLQQSLRWSKFSNGAFDITVGALMQVWGFFRRNGHIPSKSELARVKAHTGWQHVHLDPSLRSVRFDRTGIELDPGGVGKGFAADLVIEGLRTDGVKSALLSAGSSTLAALGAPPGSTGWRINVPDPRTPGAVFATLFLRNTTLSTASCAEKFFVLHGHLYCQIMDPRLARPVEGRLQATVITPIATDGDALSNVMFVQGLAARAATMRQLPAADSALVLSGIPAQDTAGAAAGASSRGKTKITGCDSYRWPSPLPAICNPVTIQVRPQESNP